MLVNSTEPGRQYMIRRSTDNGELVRTAGTRWPVEECFGGAKNEAGLDNYQVRLYRAWYRHTTLSMLAMTFLAVIRASAKKGTPGLWETPPAP